PEAPADRAGVPAGRTRELARAFAASPAAVAYGRVGSCTGSFGTLVGALLDTLNVVTGNLHRPGGAVFGHGAIPTARLARSVGIATYDTFRSRIGDFPEVLGTAPAAVMADEILTEGPGQLKALFISAGNPV